MKLFEFGFGSILAISIPETITYKFEEGREGLYRSVKLDFASRLVSVDEGGNELLSRASKAVNAINQV